MAAGLSAEEIRAVLVEEGYGHPLQAVAAWVQRLPNEPDLELPGDLSLSVEAEAHYPGNGPVVCQRYELPWWSNTVLRALAHIERGGDEDDCDLAIGQAVEVAARKRTEIYRARKPVGAGGANG